MNQKPKTLVIATSLTDRSDDVVRTGVAIARATGAVPWLVHAYTVQVLPTELGATDGSWIEEQVEFLHQQLVEQAQRTGLSTLPGFGPAQRHLTVGPPQEEILDLARQIKADLIVLGPSDRGPAMRALLGSTADGVIRRAFCPVLVVRSAAGFPPAKVEFPVDFSPVSAHAVRRGIAFLKEMGVGLDGAEALFVLNPLEVAGSLQFRPDQIERFAYEELRRFLEANGGRSEMARLRTGYPWEEILETLEERRADLAVLGTHGRHGFDRLLLGSVAAGVMHRSACNLLIVPPPEGLAKGGLAEREELAGAGGRYVPDEMPAAAGRS